MTEGRSGVIGNVWLIQVRNSQRLNLILLNSEILILLVYPNLYLQLGLNRINRHSKKEKLHRFDVKF